MSDNHHTDEGAPADPEEGYEPYEFDDEFDPDRRQFMQSMGAGVGASTLVGAETGERETASEHTGTRFPARVREDVEQPTAIRTFPVLEYDEAGEAWEQTGTRSWRTVRNTGNCCENYLSVAPDGAIYDMGGQLTLHTSDDRGETWSTVEPPTPYPITSEGCVSPTPTGDIVAVDWNPYGTDRLVAFKYNAEEDTWYYNENVLHPPFYDRPWMVVYPGPFEIAGQEVPYLVVQRGSVGRPDEVLLVSLDGLNYFYVSEREVDSTIEGETVEFLEDLPESEILDYVQPQIRGGFTPLGDGRAMADGASAPCDTVIADGDLRWSCFDTPEGFPEGDTLVDSRGYIHKVAFEKTSFTYRYSTDGGRTWAESTYRIPAPYERLGGLSDFKVNGTHDVTAVAIHASDTEEAVDQDMVFRIDGAVEGEADVELLYLGRADATYAASADTGERFDFTTLGIFPEDGNLVVSFADQTDTDPQIAVELDEKRDPMPAFDRFGIREDDSDAGTVTGGQTVRMDLQVECQREARLRDVIPIEWAVDDTEAVETIDRRPDADIQYVHFTPEGTEFDLTYYPRAPDDLSDSNVYDVGPLEVNAGDGEWRPVPDTEATYVVVGQEL
jgi:hypothetical protein